MKNSIAILIIFFLSSWIFILSQNSSNIVNDSNSIKVIFVETHSLDVVRTGDKIILYFDGTLEKYSIVTGMGYQLIAIRHLTQNEIDNIDRLFTQYNFLNYPEKFPLVKTPMWPSSGTSVKYASDENSELKSIAYSSNSKRESLPQGFLDFIKELKSKLSFYF